MVRYFLHKSQRIASEEEFRRVLAYKCFTCKGIMRLHAAPNEAGKPRFGVSVGRVCGNAVQRNRLKRLGREVFRLHQHEIPAGYDYVLIFTQKKPKTTIRDEISGKNEAQTLQYQDVVSRILGMIEIVRQKEQKKGSGAV